MNDIRKAKEAPESGPPISELPSWPGKLPPTAKETNELYRKAGRILVGAGQAFPKDSIVPLVVYLYGERHIIGSVGLSGNAGSISVFTNLPERIYEALKLGANEVQISPIPPIVVPKRLDEIGEK